MLTWHPAVEWKYFRFELLFFLSLYLLFPLLTSVEFISVEHSFVELSKASFVRNIIYNLVYFPSHMFAGIVYYVLVSRLLVTKKLVRFILYTILYLIGLVFYNKLIYLIVSHLEFLPANIRSDAAGWVKVKGLHFSITYMCREFLCIIALAWFIYAAKQDDKMRQLKEQQLFTELTYLKAQLHPHFFFNTMNNIYSLALKRSADTAPLVAKLADMMRYILYEAEHAKVPLQKEIQFLTNYIEAERIRQHSDNRITFDVQGIQPHTCIEPLLLLPFIENAFKHGLHQETENGFVHIVICELARELVVMVHNSKPRLLEERPKGIGMLNAVKRLNLLYPGRYVLNIKEEDHTYQLNLSLQVHD